MSKIDLHTHSTASDGTLTPTELMELAKESGLEAIALTDHDTTGGLKEAQEAADRLGIELIRGCELSVKHETGFMHIVGLFLPDNPEKLLEKMRWLNEHRVSRNAKILEKLEGLGKHISYEELEKKAAGGTIGRPHIALLLKEKGYVESVEEAFRKCIGDFAPAYVPKVELTPQEAIELLKSENATVILAHPCTLRLSYEEMYHELKELMGYGLDGLECYYTDHSTKNTLEFTSLANRLGLVASGGSDFHGEVKPDIRLGVGRGTLSIPDDVLEKLRAHRAKQGLTA